MIFKKFNVIILLCFLFCNVRLRHQNLSHLNRTHNEKNENNHIYFKQKLKLTKRQT